MNEKQEIIIIGTGNLARVIHELMQDTLEYEVLGYLINQPPFVRGSTFLGKPIYWIDDLEDLDRDYQALCSIYQIKKADIIQKVKSHGISFINFIHPSGYIAPSVEMGEGNVITPGVHLSSNTRVGNHNIINRGALIGHDVTINDYTSIAPGVNVASNVTIGKGSYIGMGAIITQEVTIGENSFVGAGSLVTQDVPDRVKVVGMPARIIERNIGDHIL